MTDKLPPPLLALFAPRPPLRYLAPSDYSSDKRRTRRISGVKGFLEQLNKPDPTFKPTDTVMEKQAKYRQDKKKRAEKELEKGLEEYDPDHDPKIKGDPYKVLFVSRLDYDVDEPLLEKEFSRFGPVDRIRLIRDANGKSRGYAFILFAHERDMKDAYRAMDGARILNRKIIVDVERGRTVKGWKPRRLGGGLGGRHYTKAALMRGAPDRRAAPAAAVAPPPRVAESGTYRPSYNDRARPGDRGGRRDTAPPRDRNRDRDRGGGGGSASRNRDRDRDRGFSRDDRRDRGGGRGGRDHYSRDFASSDRSSRPDDRGGSGRGERYGRDRSGLGFRDEGASNVPMRQSRADPLAFVPSSDIYGISAGSGGRDDDLRKTRTSHETGSRFSDDRESKRRKY